ncbi:MAG: hypothetical protein IJU92_04945 [Spirochaetaceae bacterium]|nr:hypothetical protein [Spirochaetaceae bacterium]
MNTAINDSSEMDAESELDDEYMEYDYFQDWSNNRIYNYAAIFSQENTETEWLEYGWPENKLTIISAEPELGYLVTMNIRNSGGITFKGYAHGNDRGGMFLENAFGPNKERVSFDIDVTDRGLLCTLTEDSHSSYIDREPREYVLIEDDDDRLKLYPHYFTYPDAKDAWSPSEELVGVWENVEGGDAPIEIYLSNGRGISRNFFPCLLL